MESIRGSYPYWCKSLNDLFAMVRQLDIPTFFCTFTAADIRWPETIQIVGKQYGHSFSTQDVYGKTDVFGYEQILSQLHVILSTEQIFLSMM